MRSTAPDQQVYYSNLLPEALPTARQNKWTADIVMAREFGHALQGRTGILISAHALGQNSGDEGRACSTRDGLKPRQTVSPACSSGPFRSPSECSSKTRMGSCRSTPPLETTLFPANLTLSEIMGSRDRANTGAPLAGTSAVGECNTFTVPSRLVR